jgi:hypothetical protein
MSNKGLKFSEQAKLNMSLGHKGHKLGHSSIYKSWWGMRNRCLNVNSIDYKNYGGRGITVCERWLKFENFFEDMSPKPVGLTLERINNDKGYSMENCKWATRTEQSRNRRFNRYFTLNGKTQNLTDWSRETGLKVTTIVMRLKYGWSVERALTECV